MRVLSVFLMLLSFNAIAERFSMQPEQDDNWQRHNHTHTQDTTVQKNGQSYNVDKSTTYEGNGNKSNTTIVTNQNNDKPYSYQGTSTNQYTNHSHHKTQTETVTNNQNNHSYTYQGQEQKHHVNGNTYSHQSGVVTNNQTGKSYNLNDTEIHSTTNTNSTVVVSPTNSTTVVVQQQPQAVYYPSYYYSPMVTPMMMGVPMYGATAPSMNQTTVNNYYNNSGQNGQTSSESGSYESALNSYMH